MDVQALLAPDAGLPLGQSRSRVLDLLRDAGSPVGVQEVAGQTGLHPNTARFHLDALVQAGLAARASQTRTRPGRPSMAYRPVEGGGAAGQRRYRLLAEMLTSLIAGVMPEPGEAAMQAGREWGRYLTEQPAPYQRLDAGEAIERLTATLEEIGFAPEAAATGHSIGSACGSARSVRWRKTTRMSCVSCTLASCRARLARCGRRSPPTGSSRSPSPASASPTWQPGRIQASPDGAQALADGNATPVRVTASPGLEAYLPASARRVPARRAARSMPESMSAGKRRSLSLATWPANNVEIHSAVVAVMVPSTGAWRASAKPVSCRCSPVTAATSRPAWAEAAAL